MKIGSLFSGHGGIDAAVRPLIPGSRVVWHVEKKPAAIRLLEHRYPDVPNLGDIKTLLPLREDGTFAPPTREIPPVDILTFGWPCQPFSSAGKRLGELDPRALWPWVAEMVRVLRPTFLFGENVGRVCTNSELRRVVRTLAAIGYVGSWRCLTASDVKAPHKRERLTLFAVRADVASDTGNGRQRTYLHGVPAGQSDAARRRELNLLPTPTQSMTTGAGTSGREGGLNLQTAVTLLPTPKASDGEKGGPGMRGSSGDLAMPSVAVQYAHGELLADKGTRWGRYAEAVEQWERVLDRPAPSPTIVSPRTGLSRNEQLSLLGDGVVPQQMLAGYSELMHRTLGGTAA